MESQLSSLIVLSTVMHRNPEPNMHVELQLSELWDMPIIVSMPVSKKPTNMSVHVCLCLSMHLLGFWGSRISTTTGPILSSSVLMCWCVRPHLFWRWAAHLQLYGSSGMEAYCILQNPYLFNCWRNTHQRGGDLAGCLLPWAMVYHLTSTMSL